MAPETATRTRELTGPAKALTGIKGFDEITNGGLPHTDQLKLIERFSRPDLDTLTYEVSIDDPGAYTRPWKASWTLRWVADQELPRQLCQDNRP